MKAIPAENSLEATFYAAEQAGLKLAIKGRLVAVLLIGVVLIASRDADRALGFVSAVVVFAGLGLLHYRLIGSRWDRAWLKYVFISIDVLLLTAAVVFLPPEPQTVLPQAMIFRFDVHAYYFVILGVAAFSFSPGLVLWTGILGAVAWIAALFQIVSGMEVSLEWADIPNDPSPEQFLAVFLNENFVGSGSRYQEATIFFVVAVLIAVVMHRARQTVRKQLESEREIASVSQLFGQFVPKAVADEMIRDKGALAPIEREATVLFVDLAGFTALTETQGARPIVEILNAWFDRATEIIGSHNGVVTQFQGDAILAVFNVPLDDRKHAENAVASAKAIQEAARSEQFAGRQLQCRVGINTGPVVAGNVGGGGRQSYTVHGDAVNLAARLEALNKSLGTQVLVSGSTAALLDKGRLKPMGETEVRGLSEPVGLFTLEDF